MNRENRAAGGLHFSTYRATTHRMGSFKSPTAGLIDFNSDLVGPAYESFMVVWDKVFKWVLHSQSWFLPLDNIWVMMIDWRLRGIIIRTALCWIVWRNVHSPQHTYVSNSYRSNRLGLSHWDPYAVHRGGCLEMYYCNMVEWFWWDSSLIFDEQLVSFSALTLLVWSSGL